MDTGRRMGIAIPGWGDGGTISPMKERLGTIPTTITTSKAGSCMRVIGTMTITDTMAITMITSSPN